MSRPKKVKLEESVQIIDSNNYIESVYENKIGILVRIYDNKGVVEYSNGIKVTTKLDNLKIV